MPKKARNQINISIDVVNRTDVPGEYRDISLTGFVLKIYESGVKSYQVHGRVRDGGIVRTTIGKHGCPWTPKMAREKAKEILHDMSKGVAPRDKKQEKQKKRLEEKRIADVEIKTKELTLRRVFEDWRKSEQDRAVRKTKDSTIKLYQDVLFKHLSDYSNDECICKLEKPDKPCRSSVCWIDKPIRNITEVMVSKRYKEVSKASVASAGNAFRALRMLFNWSIKNYDYRDESGKPLIGSNPVKIAPEDWNKLKPRVRNFVENHELNAWYLAVCKLKNQTVSDFFLFLMVTGLRSSEAASLEWSEVKLKSGRFTALDTKNGTDHTLPITDFTRKLLERRHAYSHEIGSSYVFPSDKVEDGHIHDVRFHQDLVEKDSGVKFTPHALRRTFSMVSAESVTEAQRKALLNHRDGSVTSESYTHYLQLVEKALPVVEAALLARLTETPDSDENSNVLQLAKKRKAR